MLTGSQFLFKLSAHIQKLIQSCFSFFFQKIKPLLNPRHQQIRRTACLINCQILPEMIAVHQRTIHMKDCRLGRRWQCLMRTLNYNICPALYWIFRISFMKTKMCTMRFINNQRNSIRMRNFPDFPNIWADSVIGRWSNHNPCNHFCSLLWIRISLPESQNNCFSYRFR